ncbi:TPA: TolC family outer membrane protein [Legionella pneumophila subsp. pneumophila]|uniref:TolC family outer membrane protein n=1 Tax=Legionella pneumophila TaxID=446 RepID=UPI00077079ED|nr:TolC family outer membrane protein [Legionella pneumophila]HAT9214501.1 TolC family outer membrane protein [Legionella pneumophila subsp. pneumophila]CZI81030.1 Outer membrane protein tolC precursor [Legionella pneumophila]HAT9260346.1 TolC family outer membrane protein [Legionella pneumophila subsp. pneumophila]HAT9282498.1 TolC family outer membrane protein [Legionella pneumophila subsp. pneumophila]HAT9288429.1 TolC family outer membrane protein [Legionella pneumophila subsp. pneumophila
MRKSLFCWILTLGVSTHVFATDLMDIYQQALENDTIFKEAYDTYMSSTEAIPQARAALYPQVGLGSQAGRNYQDAVAGAFSANQYYGSYLWQVNASQALFNYQAWAKVAQAKASVKAAQATFNDAAQNLILRTAKAYFDVLFAKDTLDFAEAKKRANKRQYDQATQRFQVGLDAITSVYEAKAAYDQSIATVIAARNNQINQSENLRKLTNHVYETLAPLKDSKIPLVKPEPNDVNQWIDTGLKQNYKLYAAKYNLEVAKDNVKAISAGNWPVFSLQSNASQVHNNASGNNVFIPSKQTQANIAIAMNFPVFQGGLVQAQTRQAQYSFQSTSEKLEQTYRDVIVNSRIAFNTITDGISKVKADRQTVISVQNSLQSTEAQFEVGTRTMVDVVNAQQRLFEAQEQLARDQYDLINSILTLKYLAGTLNVNDLEQINSWLATTRVNGFSPVDNKTSK